MYHLAGPLADFTNFPGSTSMAEHLRRNEGGLVIWGNEDPHGLWSFRRRADCLDQTPGEDEPYHFVVSLLGERCVGG